MITMIHVFWSMTELWPGSGIATYTPLLSPKWAQMAQGCFASCTGRPTVPGMVLRDRCPSAAWQRLEVISQYLAISRNISHMLSCLQRDLRDLGWYWMVSERILGKDKDIQRRCLCKIQKPDEKDGKFLQMTWTSSKTQKSPSWQGKLMYALQIDANDGRRARNASLWDQSRSRQIKTDQIIHGNMLSYCNIMYNLCISIIFSPSTQGRPSRIFERWL